MLEHIAEFTTLPILTGIVVGYVKNFIFCVLGSVVVLWLWKKQFDKNVILVKYIWRSA